PTLTSITNIVLSRSDTFDPDLTNNDGSTVAVPGEAGGRVVTSIDAARADLVTSKSGLTSAPAGSSVTYTITTANNGPNAAENVVITDSIIPGLTGVSASDGGTYDPLTGVVTFPTIRSLTRGSKVNREVTVVVPATDTISNTSQSRSTTFDPDPSNNNGSESRATVTTAILLAPPSPNKLPSADSSNVALAPNSVVRLGGLGGRDSDGTVVAFTISTLPSANQGILFLGDPATGGVAVTAGQTLTAEQITQLFFQASGNFIGGNFTYSATDNFGATSAAVATVSLIPLNEPIPTPTPAPIPTPTPPTPAPTPTPAPEPTPTPTPTPTPAPEPTPTPTPTPTPAPEPTPTPTPAPTPTSAPEPTPTPAPTPTLAPEPTPTPTLAPAPTPTLAPAPTPTLAPAPTPT
ncbi:hypothetical protein QUB06_25790, partial [Microcoleus sp. D2_18a_D3]